MTTQVFRGRTLNDARKAASVVLGKDAVVLSARQVRRPGIAGLFRGPEVEIAAASAPPPETLPARYRGPFASGVYAPEERREEKRDPLSALRAELRAEIRAVRIAAGGSDA